MLTISLDEQGNFEEESDKPMFIGGLLYDDLEEEGEEQEERKRIAAYYKNVMRDVGENVTYPQDLHSDGDRQRDTDVIKPVKNKVSETLPEFIARGTYAGKDLTDDHNKKLSPRKGRYHLFVLLKSDDGKRKLLSENANMLANDAWAANLYFHMAGSVVNRILFHNPLYIQGAMPPVNIDIASRATGQLDAQQEEEFRQQGYTKSRDEHGNERNFYSIMNADIYRTLIAQEMVNSEKTTTQIKGLWVRSIKYKSTARKMEFLYLSDSICSILGYRLPGDSADDWLEEIAQRVQRLNPDEENMVFGYDEIDNYFVRSWGACEKKHYYEALSIAYDAKQRQGKFAEYYRDHWFPYLEEKVRKTIKPVYFRRCINDLTDSLRANNLDQEKLLYLLDRLEDMSAYLMMQYQSPEMRAEIQYRLCDAGVSAFCHIGDAGRALGYYERCKQYAPYVGLDEFLRTANKLIVCLEDSFAWDKALQMAEENLKLQKELSKFRRKVWKKGEETSFPEEAKAASQLGRILAEQRKPEAEAYFQKALSMVEKGSANYKITQSYLLHYYADTEQKELFEQESKDYFDGKNTDAQKLRYIKSLQEVEHSAFSKEYALYVLVRGIYCFHREEIEDALWEKLCKLGDEVQSGHPWEITYKYLEMLAILRHDTEAGRKFAACRKNCLKQRGPMILALEKFGEAQIAECAGDTTLQDALTLELTEYLRENFEEMKQITFSEDGAERYRELQQYFAFMYR